MPEGGTAAEGRALRVCQKCGETIPSFAPGGNCPRCLLDVLPVLATPPGDDVMGGVRLDERFTPIEQIGEGGFGRVYLAEQHEPVRRRVALKVLKPGMDTREVLARFEAERQTLARLEHPNIARVYEAGTTLDGYPFFAMEYVPGKPLVAFAEQEGLGLRERLELFVEVCAGVQHAHLNGIIHRDLKPGNVLARRGQDGGVSVSIIDFGIAKATSPGQFDATLATLPQQAMGTPEYMAPEQAEGRADIDARADVYSLGAMLYELLSGVPPIDRESREGAGLSEVLRSIREHDPPRPSARLGGRLQEKLDPPPPWRPRDLSGDLDWIVLCALEKDVARRYQSVDALAHDVRRYLEDEPVEARPPSSFYRMRKFVRRHRAWSTAMLAAGVVLVVGTVVSILMAVRAERARGEAVEAEGVAEEAMGETARTFSWADYQQGCGLLRDNEFGAGVAHLCRALRSDPGNTAAAHMLCTTLAYTDFLVALAPEAAHPSRVVHLFFRGEDEFVTVSQGGVAGVWGRSTGRRLGDWLEHERETLLAAANSADGRYLATLSARGTVWVWDLDERSRVRRWDATPEVGGGEAIAFLEGPLRVAAGSNSGWVRMWDVESGEAQWEKELSQRVMAIDAAAGGELLAIAGGHSAAVLDAANGQLIQAGMIHGGGLRNARFDPAGRRVLTASEDGSARIWDALTGDPLVEPLRHDELVYDAVWAPGGSQVATMSFDGAARVWNAQDGTPVTGQLRHGDHVYTGVFLEGGKTLVTGSRDQRLRVWDLESGRLAAAPAVHERSVSAIAVDSDRRQVLTGGRHQQVRLLDLRPRSAAPKQYRFPGDVVFAQSHAGGRVLRTLYRGENGLAMGLVDAEAAAGLGQALDLAGIHRIDASKTCGHMVVQEGRRNVRVLANTKGDLLLEDWEHPCDLAWVEIDATGRFVFLGGTDGEATLLRFEPDAEPPRFREYRTLRPFEDGPVDDVIMLGDAPYLAAKRGDRVRVYAIDEDRWMPDGIRHEGGIGSWDFQPQHGLLITGGPDDRARLWEIRSGSLRCDPFEHADVPSGRPVLAKISPDGAYAITSSWHELSVRVWSTADGSLATNPLHLNAHVEHLVVDPNSRFLATVSDDRVLRIWNLESGQLALPEQAAAGIPGRGRFRADGGGFLAVLGKEALLWALPAISGETPAWFLEFAEQLGGYHLDPRGVLNRLQDRNMDEIRAVIPDSPGATERALVDWARWIATDPAERGRWLNSQRAGRELRRSDWENL